MASRVGAQQHHQQQEQQQLFLLRDTGPLRVATSLAPLTRSVAAPSAGVLSTSAAAYASRAGGDVAPASYILLHTGSGGDPVLAGGGDSGGSSSSSQPGPHQLLLDPRQLAIHTSGILPRFLLPFLNRLRYKDGF